MPTDTLVLPREMISAARTYAEREHITVTELFADLMNRRYGYKMTISVVHQSLPKEKKRIVPIPDSIKSISGIVSLPDGMSDNDVVYEATMSN